MTAPEPPRMPYERPLRLGYVGCGSMAQRVHLPNFTAVPGCQVVALAEVRRSLGEKVQRRYAIPRLYEDHRALAADPEVEAVAVSAPFALQGEIARECLLAGKSVFMEKPMAVSIAQADAILDAARRGGARLMVGYMKRYDVGNELVHDLVTEWRRSGEQGDLLYVRAHGFGGDWMAGIDAPVESSDEPAPPAPPEAHLPAWLPAGRAQSYVSYLQQYTHNVNLLRYLLDAGDDVQVQHVDLDEDGYTGVAVLRVAGVRCILETGTLRSHRWDEHTQVYFQRGWVHTWAPPLLLRNAVAEVEIYRSVVPAPRGGGNVGQGAAPAGGTGATGEGAALGEQEVQQLAEGTTAVLGERGIQHTITRALPEPRWSWAYQREAEHFVACLRSGNPFRSTGEDTRTDVRLFEELYRTWLQR